MSSCSDGKHRTEIDTEIDGMIDTVIFKNTMLHNVNTFDVRRSSDTELLLEIKDELDIPEMLCTEYVINGELFELNADLGETEIINEQNILNSYNTSTNRKIILTGEKSFKCNVCYRSFVDPANLRKHKIIHSKKKQESSDIKPLECDVCNKSFTVSSSLSRHKKIHLADEPPKCAICYKSFSHFGSLKSHEIRHTGKRSFECDICNKKFFESSDLKKHILRIHQTNEESKNNERKSFECNVCRKLYCNLGDLKRHQIAHNNEKQFECNTCHRFFSRLSDLRRHKLLHDGKKYFKCDRCNQDFSRSEHLQRHVLVHMIRKAFKCDLCDKAFSRSENLKKHKITHNGEKVLNGEVDRKDLLCTLDDSKVGEKLLKCNICENISNQSDSKQFARSQRFSKLDLVKHQLVFHPERFRCFVNLT